MLKEEDTWDDNTFNSKVVGHPKGAIGKGSMQVGWLLSITTRAERGFILAALVISQC